MTIDEFIAARLDEDEATAKFAGDCDPSCRWAIKDSGDAAVGILVDGGWPMAGSGITGTDQYVFSISHAKHIARHDPARVLAQVAALRAVVAATMTRDNPNMRGLQRHVAAIWADHADYDQEWKP